MKKYRNVTISVIALIIAISICFTGMTASAAGGSSPAKPNLLAVEAELYAKHFHISIDEAANRFKLMHSFPELEDELTINEPETFGGLWIQHEPDFKIVVAFTKNGVEIIRKYLPTGLPSYFEIRNVEKTQVALENEQKQLISTLDSLAIRSSSSVDIKNNIVKINIDKSQRAYFDNELQDGKLLLPDKVIINYVDEFPQLNHTVYGGLTLTSGTAGFSVKNASGTKGLITAGHIDGTQCVTSQEGDTIVLTFQSEQDSGAYDVEWHTCPSGTTITNKIRYQGSQYGPWYSVPVIATINRSSQRVGDIVFKYGNKTYQTSGEITSKTYICNGKYNSPTWMEVENIFGFPALSKNGDSGGPWFTPVDEDNVAALGITHSSTPDGYWAYYMAINYINVLGVSVLTN